MTAFRGLKYASFTHSAMRPATSRPKQGVAQPFQREAGSW